MIKKTKRTNKGFTFIEILVVVTIIGVLASMGIVSYQSANKKSRDGKRKADFEALRSALEMHRADNGYYPAALSTLTTDYLNQIPTPPTDDDCNSSGDYEDCYAPSNCDGSECETYSLSIEEETTGETYTVTNP